MSSQNEDISPENSEDILPESSEDGFQVVDGSNPADSKNSNGTATRSKVYEHFLLNKESKYGCIHCRLDVKITLNFGIKSLGCVQKI